MSLFNDFGNALGRVASALGHAVTVAVNVVVDTIDRIVAAMVDLFNRLLRRPLLTA